MAERETLINSLHVGPDTILNGMFAIDAKLASGGMGEVYRGHNITTGDPVAIKVVLGEFANDKTIISLFFKEAKILNSLNHSAIVRYSVFSVDPVIERPYLVMEYVDGKSLAEVIDRKPMAVADTRILLARLASALDAAHTAGVIHRDISPDNVILADGKVTGAKIIDFGIARAETVGTGTLLGGKFAGKYNFVSPEQLGLFGGEVTAKSDVYSLALLAVNALRGEPINMNGTPVEVVEKRRSVPDLSDIDAELRPVLELMLQPDPADRRVTMAEVAEWLTPQAEGHRSAPRPQATHIRTPTNFDAGNAEPAIDRAHDLRHSTQQEMERTRLASAVQSSEFGSTVVVPATGSQPVEDHDPIAHIRVEPASQSEPSVQAKKAALGKETSSRRSIALILALATIVAAGAMLYAFGLIGKPDQQPEIAEKTTPPAELPEPPVTKNTSPEPIEPVGETTEAPSPKSDANVAQEATQVPDKNSDEPVAPRVDPIPSNPEKPSANLQHVEQEPSRPPVPTSIIEPSKEAAQTPLPNPIKTPELPSTPNAVVSAPPASTQPDDSQSRADSGSARQEPAPPTISAPTVKKIEDVAGLQPPIFADPPKPPDDIENGKKHEADRIAWLNDFNGGACFFAHAVTNSPNSMEIEGMATDAAPFEKLDASFSSNFGFSPDIQGRLITKAQCGTAQFLTALSRSRKPSVHVTLENDQLKNGAALRGTLDNLARKSVALYLIDSDGLVYNLNQALRRDKDKGDFEIERIEQQGNETLPQLVLALASDSPVPGSLLSSPAENTVLFRNLAETIALEEIEVDFGFAFFLLGSS